MTEDKVRPLIKTYAADVWCENCKTVQKIVIPWGKLVSSFDGPCKNCGCTKEQILQEQARQIQNISGPLQIGSK